MFDKNKWSDKLPDKGLAVCEENKQLFFRTMRERMLIWKRRFILKQESPWTDDTILRDYKFTNVYRELDRNSQWQIKNILLDDTLDEINLVWKLMVFRIFNNSDTFAKAIAERGWRNGIPDYRRYDVEEFHSFIQTIRDEGKNPFTNAYFINSTSGTGMERHYFYTHRVIPTLHKKIPMVVSKMNTSNNPDEFIKFLTTIPKVANFIAHEFYQDFTYIERYTNRRPFKFNQNDYINVGPGANLGIRLIYPNLESNSDKLKAIARLRDEAMEELGKQTHKPEGDGEFYVYWDKKKRRYVTSHVCNITLHQVEMWLCEFQKYWKMQIGEGKQRSKFTVRTKEL